MLSNSAVLCHPLLNHHHHLPFSNCRPWQPDATHSRWQVGNHFLCPHRRAPDADVPLQPGRATCRGAAVHLHANLLPIAAAAPAPAAARGAGEAYNDKATSCGRQWGKSNSAYD